MTYGPPVDSRPHAQPGIPVLTAGERAHGPRWIVLLHGAFLNREVWAGYEPMLGAGHRVLTLDLPGHGSRSRAPFSVAAAVDVVAERIETVCGGSAIVVGHSLGGYTALATADARPDLVERLVLIGASAPPRGFSVPLTGVLLGLEWMPASISRACLGAMVARTSPQLWRRIAGAGLDMRHGAAAIRALHELDYWGAVRRFRGPLLVVNGTRDWIFRATETATALAAADGSLVAIPGSGHLSPIERPELVSGAIRRFTERPAGEPRRPRA
ncbi:MAG: hypothetical protein QOG62_2762 [Thermoleophilaceae bacterium]|jgi:pimeloyl-ACP methyl ester carboxylesterase|nr:hypothetical protein [Thermoleophilaceae bacterium]MEA2623018.1 hypothetical protein [Chloroflexota bacterium]